MIVKLVLTIDPAAQHKSDWILKLSDNLETYFQNKNYGEDVNEILIALICVNPPVGFEHLFKTQKPYYVKYKEVKNKYTSEQIILDRQVGFDIKISGNLFNIFISSTENQSLNIFTELILNSTSNLKLLQKKNEKF